MHAWSYQQLLDKGLSREQIRRAVAGGTLHRPHHGLYTRPADGLVDRARALLRLLPAYAYFSHQTAAQLYGFGVLPEDRLHIVVPAHLPLPDIKGVAMHQASLPIEPVERFGLPCVPAARCAIDLARASPRGDALAVLDSALRSRAADIDDLAAEVARHGRRRGVCHVRRLVQLADPRAECRQESHLRLILLDDKLPAPEPQLWIPDDCGDPRFRLDLGWQEHKVGAEYDGASHLDRDRMRHDRERHNWLETRGWRMRYFTDRDLYRRPGLIVATMRAALAA
jgi:hypothetical protein